MFLRPTKSNNLSVGIVGLPNAGKSSLFNFLTKNSVPAENYPFCTIDPTTGRVEIEDARVDFLVEKYKPKNVVKAFLSVTDIAGLVKGASEGIGLGNCFLDQIRNVDAIFHVVRCFEDNEIAHVESSVDPIRDIEIVNDELRKKDIEILSKQLERMKKDEKAKPNDKKIKGQVILVERILKTLETKWARDAEYTEEEAAFISTLNLLTVKEVVFLGNISEEEYRKKKANSHVRRVKEKYTGTGNSLMLFCATHSENKDFLNKLVKKGYEMLNLINFFTVGKDEVRSWTIRGGLKAPQAGAVIHSDFMNYFIMAEVMSFEDFKNSGSENEVKKQGKYYQRGKAYVVNDGDIILFKHNPPSKNKR